MSVWVNSIRRNLSRSSRVDVARAYRRRGARHRARGPHTRVLCCGVDSSRYLYKIFCHPTSFELVKTLYLFLSALLSLLLLPASCLSFRLGLRFSFVHICWFFVRSDPTLCVPVRCSALSLPVTPRVRYHAERPTRAPSTTNAPAATAHANTC